MQKVPNEALFDRLQILFIFYSKMFCFTQTAGRQIFVHYMRTYGVRQMCFFVAQCIQYYNKYQLYCLILTRYSFCLVKLKQHTFHEFNTSFSRVKTNTCDWIELIKILAITEKKEVHLQGTAKTAFVCSCTVSFFFNLQQILHEQIIPFV